jgi:cellulose synthase/poly-beta-1,6-N-acetylglucosamine synthase-like glycosyltransferase
VGEGSRSGGESASPCDDVAARLHARLTGAARSLLLSGHDIDDTAALKLCAIDQATFGLERAEPQFSASRVLTPSQRNVILVAAAVMLGGTSLFPSFGALLITAVIAAGYVANAVFRAWLFWVGAEVPRVHRTLEVEQNCADFPSYTVLVPLFREANVIPQLAESLRALDYPRASLDIKFIVEEGDFETVAAAMAQGADGFCEVIVVPPGKPLTKPRACNYALQLARGEYLVIFDAEDKPEPDQLKKALAAFRSGPRDVACLQARLNFFNARECWITRMFALDYALWFDFLLPGLDRLGIPMPLGGTSNHFRVDALRAIHAWDPFNVTEDADLGIRLARLGLRVRTLDSTTYEEATNALPNWLRQRTRWLKGYMQTWLVHMRSPRQLVRNAGLGGFFGFQLFVGGTVLSALLNPLLWSIFALSFFVDIPVMGFLSATHTISGLSLLLGNVLFAYLAMLGPYRRGWLDLSPFALLVPIYWLLISAAAYRALWQLVRDPWLWEKTPHGTSRMQSTGTAA